MEIDFFPGLDQTEETIIFLGLAFVVFLSAYIFFKWSRRVRTSDAHMTVQELDKLKNKKLLTDEELKRVRSSMARQYMEVQKEEEDRQNAKGLKGLDALAIELEKVESNLKHEPPAQDDLPRESQTQNLQPAPLLPNVKQGIDEKDSEPEPVAEKKELPQNLKAYLGMSDFELDDAVNAGFLTQAEKQQVLEFKESDPS